MPELPEVETTVSGLRAKVLQRTFVNVWTDSAKQVKKPSFEEFKKKIKGKKIKDIYRKGKNIVFDLSEEYSLLIHQKMTGHLLCGEWEKTKKGWKPKNNKAMEDRMNSYIHFMFYLDKGMMALSDLRKFAKIQLWKTEELKSSKELSGLGPDALKVSLDDFKKILKEKKGKIKQVLMKQEVLAGAGNIYSDEALFRAGINPFREPSSLEEKELEKLYTSLQEVLRKAIKLKGESISDYRDVEGKKGDFDRERKVYRREGEECPVCGSKIKRKKIGGRSAHFCPQCQL